MPVATPPAPGNACLSIPANSIAKSIIGCRAAKAACRKGACRKGVCRKGVCRKGVCRKAACRKAACRTAVCRKAACRKGVCRKGVCRKVACLPLSPTMTLCIQKSILREIRVWKQAREVLSKVEKVKKVEKVEKQMLFLDRFYNGFSTIGSLLDDFDTSKSTVFLVFYNKNIISEAVSISRNH